jgi:thymidylate kinase
MIVAVRGVDGAGKSTAVAAVVSALQARGQQARAVKIALIANPAFIRYRDLLRTEPLATQLLIRPALTVAETLRAVRCEVLPADRVGDVVVCDRYWLDSAAYLEHRGLANEASRAALRALPDADLEVILDVPLDIAEARCRVLGERWTPRLRRLLRCVHDDLASRPSGPGVHHLNGMRSIGQVTTDILELVATTPTVRR